MPTETEYFRVEPSMCRVRFPRWKVRVEGSTRTPSSWRSHESESRLKDILLTNRHVILLATIFLVVGLVVACTDATNASPLSHGSQSPEGLARAALNAFLAGDQVTLAELRVTREEYETVLWPVLPDGDHVPFDFVWSLTEPRSRKAVRELMSEYAGVPLELVRVDLGQEIEAYEAFKLYLEARMTVRRTDTGAEGLFPLMDVLVEMGGGWKFLNFGEDI